MTFRSPSVQAHTLLSLVTLATFARAVPYPFQVSWDDGRFIVDNRDVHEVSWRSFESIVSGPQFQAYHPLHLLSYWLDVPWAGPNAPLLHAVNLLLWMIAANLLLRACTSLGLSMGAALIATGACVLHPVQVEAVSWATGRKDVLAMLFCCACALLHLRAERWSDRYAWLARGAFLLALLSKTTALPLPAVLFLADVCLRRRKPKEAVAHQWPSAVLGIGVGVYVITLWRSEQMLRGGTANVASAPSRVVATFAHQLSTALWPSSTSPMYSTEAVTSPSTIAWLVCVALLALALLAQRRGLPRAVFSLGAFALLLLPVSNAVPMYFPYQDRYLSLPLLALCFGLGAAIDTLRRGARNAALTLSALLVFSLALRCWQYQGEWRSEPRLWGHAASVQPDAYYAWMKLGEVRRRASDLYGAIRAYQRLLQLDSRRKLGHAALLEAVALRDEKLRKLAPSQAELYAKQYYDALSDPEALRELAARMLESGHLRALELPLGRALTLQTLPDAALEHAASSQFAQGRPSVALFYLEHMHEPTRQQELQALAGLALAQQASAPKL